MTIPLVLQLANTAGAEFKETQRRFIAQTLLSTVNPRAAGPSEVGRRAFDLWLFSLPLEKRSDAASQGKLEAFQQTTREMLTTNATKPLISPIWMGLISSWIVWKWLGPKLMGYLDD